MSRDRTTALSVESVSAGYGTRIVVNNVSFAATVGSISAIVGLNGAGKTTLLRVIAGLKRPVSGRVLVGGVDIRQRQGHAGIALVLQKIAIDRQLTGGEYLKFAARARGIPRAAARAAVKAAEAELDLAGLLDRRGSQLSGGQARRLQLAGSLVRRPRVLLLDEPTAGLDPKARRNYWKIIRQLAAGGLTVIMVTHHIDEAKFADAVLILADGRVISHGRPDDLVGQSSLSVVDIDCTYRDDAAALHGRLQMQMQSDRTDNVVSVTTTDPAEVLSAALDMSPTDGIEIQVRPATFDDLLLHLTNTVAADEDA